MKLKPYDKSGLYRAEIALGGISKMARTLTAKTGKPVSRQVIFQWRKYGRIPAWFIPHIHSATLIPYEDLLEAFEPEQKDKMKMNSHKKIP
jgi:hypothetical protein